MICEYCYKLEDGCGVKMDDYAKTKLEKIKCLLNIKKHNVPLLIILNRIYQDGFEDGCKEDGCKEGGLEELGWYEGFAVDAETEEVVLLGKREKEVMRIPVNTLMDLWFDAFKEGYKTHPAKVKEVFGKRLRGGYS